MPGDINEILMLLIDGVKYHLHEFKEEREFESVVEEHAKDIFGEESIYFGKKKISSLSGIGSIPDGYAITFKDTQRWYVVEVELSSHRIFNHVVPQINKFINGIRSDRTKRELINYMNEEIRSQPIIEHLIKERFGEVYKFLSDLIYKPPIVLIIIDEKTKELDDVVSSIPAETKVLEFKTFEREGVGLGVHAHLFSPLFSEKQPEDIIENIRKMVLSWGNVKELKTKTAITFKTKRSFLQVYPEPQKNLLMINFPDGYKLVDNMKLLKGRGKYGRYIKILRLLDSTYLMIKDYIKQAYENSLKTK
ncbi:MAG: DUF5655 domain-containing protein [Nitrososphaerales archaeon]